MFWIERERERERERDQKVRETDRNKEREYACFRMASLLSFAFSKFSILHFHVHKMKRIVDYKLFYYYCGVSKIYKKSFVNSGMILDWCCTILMQYCRFMGFFDLDGNCFFFWKFKLKVY